MTDRRPDAFGFTSRDQPQTTTVQALAAFRTELIEAGFDPDDVREMCLVALAEDVRRDGLNVRAPE